MKYLRNFHCIIGYVGIGKIPMTCLRNCHRNTMSPCVSFCRKRHVSYMISCTETSYFSVCVCEITIKTMVLIEGNCNCSHY